jgi:hypothetical protein
MTAASDTISASTSRTGVSLSEILDTVDALCVIVETSKSELLVEASPKKPDRFGLFELAVVANAKVPSAVV